VCAQVTQTKTGLSAIRTFSPLGINFNNFQKKNNLHRLWISSCNISTVGLRKKLKFVSNSFFSFITYSFLLIDFFEV
jgi:hypothetical protein